MKHHAILQSIVITDMPVKEAVEWARRHHYHDVPDITEHTIRFRQYDPHLLEREGYYFRTKAFKHGYFVFAIKG
jgi:hypothetical protein